MTASTKQAKRLHTPPDLRRPGTASATFSATTSCDRLNDIAKLIHELILFQKEVNTPAQTEQQQSVVQHA